jgi:formylglycine-generating enzyme required for sulfatase activity
MVVATSSERSSPQRNLRKPRLGLAFGSISHTCYKTFIPVRKSLLKLARAVNRIVFAITVLAVTTAFADIGYQFVTVGNPGNSNDTVEQGTGSGLYLGGVNYIYSMGKYDVTVSQYTTFLNAVAATDNYSLYHPSMATDLNIAGISKTGSSGSYAYSVIGSGQHPVTYVSWFDAARFANWMANGQPVGLGEVAASTEQGAYTLNGLTSGGLSITKNSNAAYWIPGENEWYKAAYYDPNLNGGSGGYWQYPTRSNTAPGNIVGGSANQANYRYSSTGGLLYSVTQSSSLSSRQNYLTDVGAFTQSASSYGTYDMGGEVYQWDDTVKGSTRGLRGGTWSNNYLRLMSSSRGDVQDPAFESNIIGFRLATSVPEPTTIISFIVGVGILACWRKRKRVNPNQPKQRRQVGVSL